MSDLAENVLAGAVAGFAATGPMTLFMEGVRAVLPPEEQHPAPPRRITVNTARAAGVEDDLSEPQKQALTLAGHFGYGSAAGALYGALAPALPFSPALNGVTYGLAVWAGSYLGWLPAVGLHPPATRESPGRNVMTIGAHVVWGAVLGWLNEEMAGRSDDRPTSARADGRRRARSRPRLAERPE